MNKVVVWLKRMLMRTFFSKGRAMKIYKGPLKGYKYIVKPDTGFSSLLGRWEKESQLIYFHSIFKDFVVFDLGANYGIHSMLYSKLVGDKGRVYAFEPLPSNVADLKSHIQMNGIKNIEVVQEAISNKKGKAEFKIASHKGQGALQGIGKDSDDLLRVDTDTLDDFCQSHNVYPDFIKVDIEGAEGFALEGFNEAVKRSYPFFAIDLHNPRCDKAVGRFLSEHGYEVYRIKNSYLKGIKEQKKFLERIKKLDQPYPNPEGIWGVVWAVHPSKRKLVADFITQNT